MTIRQARSFYPGARATTKGPRGRYTDWGAPPGKPYRYRLIGRLADIYHGRRDGRKPIPQVTPPPETPEQNQEDLAILAGRSPGASMLAAEPRRRHAAAERGDEPVGTPQLLKLRALARDLMSQERIAWLTESKPVRQRLGEIRADIQRLSEDEQATRHALMAAAVKPTDEDLKERRIAESDPGKRPDRLIRDRRQTEFTRRQVQAEQAHTMAVYRLAQAHQQELECQNALKRRAAIARTRAHWIYEYAWRRTATYWQHLVRVHPHGAYLNARLRPVGPELPAWAQDPPDDNDEPEV
jgi:hypothetical protein